MHTCMNDNIFNAATRSVLVHMANYVYTGAHTYVSGIIVVFWIRIRIDLALPDPDLFWK